MLRTVAPEIVEAHARPAKPAALTLRERSRHVEADQIRAALAAHDGDRDAVCDALGISKTTLWRKLNAAAR
jgi:propionate catabolism operon transcriptional regulator